MTKKPPVKKKKTGSSKKITFHYDKTPSYRSYHVDGIFGGLTPRGKIYCELFIDRNPTPQTSVHELSKDGVLSGIPIKKTGKDGIIREVECGMIFDIDTATTFKEWLESKIKQYKEENLKLSNKGRK